LRNIDDRRQHMMSRHDGLPLFQFTQATPGSGNSKSRARKFPKEISPYFLPAVAVPAGFAGSEAATPCDGAAMFLSW
jgi:hypothetical protein